MLGPVLVRRAPCSYLASFSPSVQSVDSSGSRMLLGAHVVRVCPLWTLFVIAGTAFLVYRYIELCLLWGRSYVELLPYEARWDRRAIVVSAALLLGFVWIPRCVFPRVGVASDCRVGALRALVLPPPLALLLCFFSPSLLNGLLPGKDK